MLELSRTGKIVRWQNGGSDRDLLVRPRSRSGLPGGANLCLTHRGVEYLKRDWAPNLQPTHADQNTFTAEVGHETDPNILWRYRLTSSITEDHNFITCQTTLERKSMWPRSALMPVTLGYMFRVATQGNFVRLMMNGVELASTHRDNDRQNDYDYDLQPMSACSMSDSIVVETAYGQFVLTAVSGVDGIVLDTTMPDRYFGVMLTGGAFTPLTVAPEASIIQTTSVRFEPKVR